MAGRMGGDRQTTLNLTVERVDTDNGVLLIRGAVPGSDGSIVFVRAAKKGAK
jgi:large subunit ribosomal protein L3